MNMNTRALGKFCPVCKLSNEPGALICVHCGASLDKSPTGPPTTQQVKGPRVDASEKTRRPAPELAIPAEGLALYITGSIQPVAIRTEEEFLIGRLGDDPSEPLIDLAEVEGFSLGVSRRHVMIRAAGGGYEIIDLNSKNGTWLDGKRLVPNQPHALPSGAHLLLGRMDFIVMYQSSPDVK